MILIGVPRAKGLPHRTLRLHQTAPNLPGGAVVKAPMPELQLIRAESSILFPRLGAKTGNPAGGTDAAGAKTIGSGSLG